MKLLLLKSIIQSAVHTFYRFPLVVISSVLLTVIEWYMIEQSHYFFWTNKLFQVLLLAIPLFFTVRLYFERYTLPPSYRYYPQIFVFAFLITYYNTLPKDLSIIQYIRFTSLTLSFHLLVAFAPYIQRQEANGFWQYNQKLFLRLLLSLLYSTVLFTGIVVALLIIDQLFDIHIRQKVYIQLGVFILSIFNTSFFAAGIPENFAQLQTQKEYPKGLKIFAEFILLPLVALYLFIMYSYLFKIVVEWDLPKGWITYLIVAFSIAGIFSLLLIYPLQNDTENKWLLVFSRWFYFALLPLIILLLISIIRRIKDYGVTESRYFVILIILWLTGVSLYFLLSKVKNIKHIPISFCVILLLSSFGPWNAFKVSQQSQIRRFESFLKRNHLLDKKGIIQQDENIQITHQNVQQLIAIIHFFGERNLFSKLQPYFKPNLDSLTQDEINLEAKKRKILTQVSTAFVQNFPESSVINTLNFSSSQERKVQNITGFDYIIQVEVYGKKEYIFPLKGKFIRFKAKFDENKLQIVQDKTTEVLIDFDLNTIIQKLIDKFSSKMYDIPFPEMTLIEESNSYKARLHIQNITVLHKTKTQNTFTGLSGQLFLKFY